MNPRSGLSNMQNAPEMTAERAYNCDLLSGDLRPHRQVDFITGLGGGGTPQSAFRIPNANGPGLDEWIHFDQRYTHFLESPLVGDTFNRWYWTEEGEVPRFNTQARILNSDAPYRLGVPAPISKPTVTPPGTSGALQRQRCYLYCFVNEFGEVGPPSPVTCEIGDEDTGWVVANMDTTVPSPWDTDGASITTKRIFRTVTGATGGSFFFVADVPLAQASYTDNEDTGEVAYREQLNTAAFLPPPEDLIGLVAHPNGFLAAYRKNELWMSFPYRPYAWPIEYVLATESNIRGLGVYGNSIVVTTEAHPYTVTGVHPEAMSFTKYQTTEPNFSRDSVVTLPQGVMYAGANGLVLAHNQRFDLVTQSIMTYHQWQNRYKPELVRGTRFGFQYIGWTSAPTIDENYQAAGFIYAPDEQNMQFSELRLRDLTTPETPDAELKAVVDNTLIGVFQTDPYNGQVYVTIDNELFWLFGETAPPATFQWKSKEYVTAKPVNFGAYDVDFTRYDTLTEVISSALLDWNKNRIAFPLGAVGMSGVGLSGGSAVGSSSDMTVEPFTLPANRQAVGGSPLYSIGEDSLGGGNPYITVRIYADRRLIHERTIDNTGQFRGPSGFKAYRWQFEFLGNCELKYFNIAETGKELANA